MARPATHVCTSCGNPQAKAKMRNDGGSGMRCKAPHGCAAEAPAAEPAKPPASAPAEKKPRTNRKGKPADDAERCDVCGCSAANMCDAGSGTCVWTRAEGAPGPQRCSACAELVDATRERYVAGYRGADLARVVSDSTDLPCADDARIGKVVALVVAEAEAEAEGKLKAGSPVVREAVSRSRARKAPAEAPQLTLPHSEEARTLTLPVSREPLADDRAARIMAWLRAQPPEVSFTRAEVLEGAGVLGAEDALEGLRLAGRVEVAIVAGCECFRAHPSERPAAPLAHTLGCCSTCGEALVAGGPWGSLPGGKRVCGKPACAQREPSPPLSAAERRENIEHAIRGWIDYHAALPGDPPAPTEKALVRTVAEGLPSDVPREEREREVADTIGAMFERGELTQHTPEKAGQGSTPYFRRKGGPSPEYVRCIRGTNGVVVLVDEDAEPAIVVKADASLDAVPDPLPAKDAAELAAVVAGTLPPRVLDALPLAVEPQRANEDEEPGPLDLAVTAADELVEMLAVLRTQLAHLAENDTAKLRAELEEARRQASERARERDEARALAERHRNDAADLDDQLRDAQAEVVNERKLREAAEARGEVLAGDSLDARVRAERLRLGVSSAVDILTRAKNPDASKRNDEALVAELERAAWASIEQEKAGRVDAIVSAVDRNGGDGATLAHQKPTEEEAYRVLFDLIRDLEERARDEVRFNILRKLGANPDPQATGEQLLAALDATLAPRVRRPPPVIETPPAEPPPAPPAPVAPFVSARPCPF